jgi:hypothetical protein
MWAVMNEGAPSLVGSVAYCLLTCKHQERSLLCCFAGSAFQRDGHANESNCYKMQCLDGLLYGAASSQLGCHSVLIPTCNRDCSFIRDQSFSATVVSPLSGTKEVKQMPGTSVGR